MKFFIWHSFTWTYGSGPSEFDCCVLSAPRCYTIPFYPSVGDILTVGGISGRVERAVWDCDDGEGRIWLNRNVDEKSCGIEWAKELSDDGWKIEEYFEPPLDEMPSKVAPTAKPPEVKPTPKQSIEPGLDFDRIAQIMKDTQRTSEILQKAMGE